VAAPVRLVARAQRFARARTEVNQLQLQLDKGVALLRQQDEIIFFAFLASLESHMFELRFLLDVLFFALLGKEGWCVQAIETFDNPQLK
jgi:hypothetical protein